MKRYFKKIIIDKKKCFETGVLLGLVLIVVFLFKRDDYLLYWGMASLLISLIAPLVWWPLAYVWFALAQMLSLIFQPIMLCMVFFLVITPVGLLRRLIGKDALQLKKFDSKEPTAFYVREQTFSDKDMDRLF
ncbi:MAG: hypothetical protein ACFCUU_04500 [Cyclobacteriaceae bacterium]